jgi:hypothetical protein
MDSSETGPRSLPDLVRGLRITLDPRTFTRLGAAHARRRTLAAGILPFARSMLTSLRHPWLRSSATPAPGHGQPLAASRSTGLQPVCVLGSRWVRGSHVGAGCQPAQAARGFLVRGRFQNGEQSDRGHAQTTVTCAEAGRGYSLGAVHAAGFENVTGRLRRGDDTRGSRENRISDHIASRRHSSDGIPSRGFVPESARFVPPPADSSQPVPDSSLSPVLGDQGTASCIIVPTAHVSACGDRPR